MPATTTASRKNGTGTSQQAYESLLNGYFEDRDMKISDGGQSTPQRNNSQKAHRHKSARMNKSQTMCSNRYVEEAQDASKLMKFAALDKSQMRSGRSTVQGQSTQG